MIQMTNWEKYFGTPDKTAETLAEQKPMLDAFYSWADNYGALLVSLVPPKGNAMHEKEATACYSIWLQEEAS